MAIILQDGELRKELREAGAGDLAATSRSFIRQRETDLSDRFYSLTTLCLASKE